MRLRPLAFIGALAVGLLAAHPALASLKTAPTGPGRGIFAVVLLGALVLSWVLSRDSWSEKRRDLKYGLIWGAIFLGVVAIYGLREDFAYVWRSTIAELSPAHAVATDHDEIMLAADADGHFRVETEVNGVPLIMMIDTGASHVALSRADAEAVGIDVDSLEYTIPYVTANGVAMKAQVMLKSVRIAGIEVRDVKASVSEGRLSGSLLGMSFLKRLSKVEMSPTRLVLRQ